MNIAMSDLTSALRDILSFRDRRDWGPYHTPQHLAAALSIEAAELQELFLWKKETEIKEIINEERVRGRLAEEIADVLIYALLFCHETQIDPLDAIKAKLALNEGKYPVDRARGNSRKYDQL
jgi:NTP pyrophosphatase (non-canonical NTP hydrolase)